MIEAARMGISGAGCDLSVPGIRSALRFAESEGVTDRVSFVVSAAERLPFPDGVFA